MTDPIEDQTVLNDVAHAEQLEHMRHTWNVGRTTAAAAAGTLRQITRKLTELRPVPLPALPPTDPSTWHEPARPTGPHIPAAIDNLFSALIDLVQLASHDYERHGRDLAHALTDLPQLIAPAELRGCMAEGYTPERVNAVFARLSALTGHRIVCVWDYCDGFGYDGNPDFYIESANGEALHHLSGDLRAWLSAQPNNPTAPATAGDPATWLGSVTGEFTRTDLPVSDGLHNYATHDRR